MILIVQCLYQGYLHAKHLVCSHDVKVFSSEERFLLATNAVILPAAFPSVGSKQAVASYFSKLCCNYNCKCRFLIFMGQKTRWIHLREGTYLLNEYINKYKKNITEKCFYDNIAGTVFEILVALSFTLWPLLFVAFSFN